MHVDYVGPPHVTGHRHRVKNADVNVFTRRFDAAQRNRLGSNLPLRKRGTGRAWLGVHVEEETELDEGGARVLHVSADSPADSAGLREGDVIAGWQVDRIEPEHLVLIALHGRKDEHVVSVAPPERGDDEFSETEDEASAQAEEDGSP